MTEWNKTQIYNFKLLKHKNNGNRTGQRCSRKVENDKCLITLMNDVLKSTEISYFFAILYMKLKNTRNYFYFHEFWFIARKERVICCTETTFYFPLLFSVCLGLWCPVETFRLLNQRDAIHQNK